MINKNIKNLTIIILLILVLGCSFFFSKEVDPPVTKIQKEIDIKSKI